MGTRWNTECLQRSPLDGRLEQNTLQTQALGKQDLLLLPSRMCEQRGWKTCLTKVPEPSYSLPWSLPVREAQRVWWASVPCQPPSRGGGPAASPKPLLHLSAIPGRDSYLLGSHLLGSGGAIAAAAVEAGEQQQKQHSA